jgi:hypothetical protein
MHAPQAQMHPYKLLHVYPGMRPKDEVIWDKFIQEHPGIFDACWYNVPVGDPAHNDIERGVMKFNGGFGVTQWRVDVLAQKDGKHYVIEVKPSADTHAIGEVLAYRALLIAEGKIQPDAEAIIITNDASMILLQAATALGVAVQQV